MLAAHRRRLPARAGFAFARSSQLEKRPGRMTFHH